MNIGCDIIGLMPRCPSATLLASSPDGGGFRRGFMSVIQFIRDTTGRCLPHLNPRPFNSLPSAHLLSAPCLRATSNP